MKTKILLLTTVLLMALNLHAQVPYMFNYQGVARDNNGAPLTNQQLGLKISILSANNTILYEETHTATTNDLGLYNIAIGNGTQTSMSDFEDANWEDGDNRIEVQIDPTGGTNYTSLGVSDLLSTPYAIHSKTAFRASFANLALAPWSHGSTGIAFDGSPANIGDNVAIGVSPALNNSKLYITGSSSGPFVWIEPSSLSGNQDILGLNGTGSGPYQFIEANNGTANVFIVNEDGSTELDGNLILHSGSDQWDLQIYSSGNLGFNYNGALASYITTNGTYVDPSDRRLKENIVPVGAVLDKVKAIEVMRFNYKKDKNKTEAIGYIAQNLKKQFPEFVSFMENDEGEGYYGVNYGGMSAVAIKAIQEQQRLIEAQQQLIENLQERLGALENLFNSRK